MTPTPPSTNSSSGASPDAQFRIVRKRNRVPLSCAPCRLRKLKCNRGHPCDNCTKRGDSGTCSYAAPTSRKKSIAAGGPTGTPDDMQNRIDRLESLVLSLMTNGNDAAGSAAAHQALSTSRSNSMGTSLGSLDVEGDDMIREQDGEESDVNDVAEGIGIMKVSDGKTIFASDAHWYAILADITEVKNYFANHKEQYVEQIRRVKASAEDDSPGITFLFKAPRLNDKAQVLATFPTKTATDRLVARYFNSYDPAIHIIHGPTFQKQYDRHWASPNDSPVVFLALLYAIMTLALQSYHRANDEPPEYRGKSLQLSVSFGRLTAQALTLADIKEPLPQMIEALILHMQAEFCRNRDAETGVLILVSIITRLAMKMGYHRDAAPYPTISPFQGEMRRRVWTFVKAIDLLFSLQFGQPAMVRSDCADAQLPRNLYDDELYEDMQSLPPSRPESEVTPTTYMIMVSKFIDVFSQIYDRTMSISVHASYDEVLNLDNLLKETRQQIPHHLKVRSLAESMNDSPNVIMQRFGLEMMYLKARCMLHRKFPARGRDSQRYAFSRRACVESSMEMLSYQATIHREGQPGGRLRSAKWYISSLTTNDFLLAAMVVCLDLYHTAEAERRGRKSSPASPPAAKDVWAIEYRREEMMAALKCAVVIWDSLRDQSMEAWKAATTLRIMIEKLMAHQAMQGTRQVYPNPQVKQQTPQYSATGSFPMMFPNGQVSVGDDLPPEQSAAMTLGLLSSGGISPSGFGMNANMGMSSPGDSRGYPASMASLLNDPLPERTGLTPQYPNSDTSGVGSQGMTGALSPFSQLFGQSGGGGGNMHGVNDMEWGAWDSFVQGQSMDPTNFAGMVPEFNFMDAQLPQLQHQYQHLQGGGGVLNSGIFMGATTPGNGM